MTRDEQISALKKAVLRAEEEEQKLFPLDHPEVCCKDCMYGREYRKWTAKQERRLGWLTILLEKRGSPDDLGLVRAIKMSAWP